MCSILNAPRPRFKSTMFFKYFRKSLRVFSFFFIPGLLFGSVPASADQEALAQPYEAYSADKRCMAKSVPDNRYINKKGREVWVMGGDKGTTEVYVLGPNGEKIPNAKYDWFAYGMVLKCFKNSSGGTSVALIRTHGWSQGHEANDYALGYAFYVDGKLMNRYSTLDITLFPDNVSASVSHYTFLKKFPGIQKGPDGKEVFQVVTLDGRTVSFDLPSGGVTSHLKDTALQRRLFDAVGRGDIDGIKQAMKQGADINAWYRDGYARPFGWTPLRYAMKMNQEAATRFLIAQGADVNAKSFDGIYFVSEENYGGYKRPEDAPYFMVFQYNQEPRWVEPTPAVLKNILNNKNHVRHEGRTLLYDMAAVNAVPYVKLLIEKGADPNQPSTDGFTPLHAAVDINSTELAGLLIKQGADPNAVTRGLKYAPVHRALLHRSAKMLEFLLDHGAAVRIGESEEYNPSKPPMDKEWVPLPLHVAADIDHLESFKILVQKGADIHLKWDWSGDTAIHKAAQTPYGKKVLLYLLDNGADIEERSGMLWTPLLSAVWYSQVDKAQILLDRGADPNAKNKDKQTVFQVAVRHNKWKFIKPLVAKGADVHVRYYRGGTVLDMAVSRRAPEWVFKYFAELGVDPNAQDKNGDTPLHNAVGLKEIKQIKFLLALGADPDIKNKQGQSPRSLARKMGFRQYLKLFDKASGKGK